MAFNAIGLFGRYQDAAIKATLTQIRSHLEARGNVVFLGDTTHQEIDGLRISDTGRSIEESIDLGIVVGGDGTMLHVANAQKIVTWNIRVFFVVQFKNVKATILRGRFLTVVTGKPTCHP